MLDVVVEKLTILMTVLSCLSVTDESMLFIQHMLRRMDRECTKDAYNVEICMEVKITHVLMQHCLGVQDSIVCEFQLMIIYVM